MAQSFAVQHRRVRGSRATAISIRRIKKRKKNINQAVQPRYQKFLLRCEVVKLLARFLCAIPGPFYNNSQEKMPITNENQKIRKIGEQMCRK